jgi:hypothetical protein
VVLLVPRAVFNTSVLGQVDPDCPTPVLEIVMAAGRMADDRFHSIHIAFASIGPAKATSSGEGPRLGLGEWEASPSSQEDPEAELLVSFFAPTQLLAVARPEDTTVREWWPSRGCRVV